jgi:hypothetical protein
MDSKGHQEVLSALCHDQFHGCGVLFHVGVVKNKNRLIVYGWMFLTFKRKQ